MHCFDNTTLEAVSLHKIGNKIGEEDIRTSSRVLSLNDDLTNLLLNFFLMPLKKEIYFNFFDERSLNYHIVYNSVSHIFENPESLLEESVILAKHLYEQGDNPKIKNGEFYTAYFENCELDGESVDAVGLFKSEHLDHFLKIRKSTTSNDYELQEDIGINTQKLDKGCLIFNSQKENGYVVCVLDSAKNSEGGYWIDLFLKLRERTDEFYYTQIDNVTYFHSSQNINDLANGDICITLGWSGDLLMAADRAQEANNGVDIEYIVPKEGALIFYDMMAIPADAEHTENALLFINFLMRPDVIAKISSYTSYASGNKASVPFVVEKVRNNPNIYIPQEMLSKMFLQVVLPQKVNREINKIWTRVRTGE